MAAAHVLDRGGHRFQHLRAALVLLSILGLVSLASTPVTGGAGAAGAGAAFGGAWLALTLGALLAGVWILYRVVRGWMALGNGQGHAWLTRGVLRTRVRDRTARRARGLWPEGPALSTRTQAREVTRPRRRRLGTRGAEFPADSRILPTRPAHPAPEVTVPQEDDDKDGKGDKDKQPPDNTAPR